MNQVTETPQLDFVYQKLNKKECLILKNGLPKINYFMWIYFEIGRKTCLDSLCSQHGHEGDLMFAELESCFTEAQVEAAKQKDEQKYSGI